MPKHEMKTIIVTAGRKKIGELLVSAELADDIRFDPNFPDEPERTDATPDGDKFDADGDEK